MYAWKAAQAWDAMQGAGFLSPRQPPTEAPRILSALRGRQRKTRKGTHKAGKKARKEIKLHSNSCPASLLLGPSPAALYSSRVPSLRTPSTTCNFPQRQKPSAWRNLNLTTTVGSTDRHPLTNSHLRSTILLRLPSTPRRRASCRSAVSSRYAKQPLYRCVRLWALTTV